MRATPSQGECKFLKSVKQDNIDNVYIVVHWSNHSSTGYHVFIYLFFIFISLFHGAAAYHKLPNRNRATNDIADGCG